MTVLCDTPTLPLALTLLQFSSAMYLGAGGVDTLLVEYLSTNNHLFSSATTAHC